MTSYGRILASGINAEPRKPNQHISLIGQRAEINGLSRGDVYRNMWAFKNTVALVELISEDYVAQP